MPDAKPKLVWRATIKRATMSQKFNEQGEVRNVLQLVCDGDMLPADDMRALTLLQKETVVVITIEPQQIGFDWTIPATAAQEGGNSHAEVPDEGAGGGGDPPADPSDDLGIL